jgi:hypothetical protein
MVKSGFSTHRKNGASTGFSVWQIQIILMKNVLFIFVCVLVSNLCLAAPITPPKEKRNPSKAVEIVQPIKPIYMGSLAAEMKLKSQTTLVAENEALYCSVTVGNNSGSCWFCDCAALVAQLSVAN